MKTKIYNWLWVNYTHNQFTFQKMFMWIVGVGFCAYMFALNIGMVSFIWFMIAGVCNYFYIKEYNNLEKI